MSSTRYARLANADTELDAAFDDEHEHMDVDDEPASSSLSHAPRIPGAYDFEREYDFPPPGSPPAPSTRALPNDYGNSNGLLPTDAPVRPPPHRPSFLRRAVGALLPSHYVRVPTSDASSSRTIGNGNDGVFANVVAKPQRAQSHVDQEGSIYMVPEETSQKDIPPSYADAQADAVPPYWETTIHAPSTDPNDPMIIDDLPTGSPWLFFTNLFISYFFQFIGFVFTYLLHTSHAAKYGSRAGLGLTLIQLGFYSRNMSSSSEADAPVPTPFPTSNVPGAGNAPVADDTIPLSFNSRDWLAFLFMTLGWFVFLSSLIGYIRIKRWERSIRSPPTPVTPPSQEAVERDREIRRNLANVFGLAFDEEEGRSEPARGRAVDQRVREEMEAQDARLARDLRAAGLL